MVAILSWCQCLNAQFSGYRQRLYGWHVGEASVCKFVAAKASCVPTVSRQQSSKYGNIMQGMSCLPGLDLGKYNQDSQVTWAVVLEIDREKWSD